MLIVSMIASIGSLVCWILTLIKMFQSAGVVHGILGIICGLYAFIWGWIHAAEENLKNVMLIWTVCLVVNIGSQVAIMSSAEDYEYEGVRVSVKTDALA
jgi:hypothetical protein